VDFLRTEARTIMKHRDSSELSVEAIYAAGGSGDDPAISLHLKQVSYYDALTKAVSAAGKNLVVEEYAFIVCDGQGDVCAPRTPEEAASKIIFPKIDFEDVSLAETLEYFRVKAKDYDPAKVGVNLLATNQQVAEMTHFSLRLANVPLKDALLKIAAITGWKVRFDPRVVVITPATQPAAVAIKPDANSPLMQRASRFIRPQVQFQNASVEEAVELLRMPMHEDTRRPVNIVSHLPARLATAEIISLDLRDVSMVDVLGYIAEMAGLRLRVDENAFVLEEAKPVGTNEKGEKAQHPESKIAMNPQSKNEELASKIVLPNVQFGEATVQECVEFLRVKTSEIHSYQGDSMAVKIVLATPKDAVIPKVALFLKDASVRDVLRYVAELAELKLRVADDAFVLETK
jgi:hypothetical protein